MKEIILAYQGEMTLKGLNRGKFEARLSKIIRWRLEPLGKFKVYQAQSTVFIEPKEEGLDMDEAFRRVSHVFGIVKMSRAVECPKDFDAICETAEAYLGETLRGIRTFKVEAKRADKTYPMKSPEICRELGAYLLDKHHHLRVDVHNPQLEVMVEIRDHSAYVHGPKVEAAGGLPVGTSGRALNLLSGGIDSPVAAWCMARRGLALHHIHFASPPYTSLRAKMKVRDLARELVEYTGNCTLFVVPYTKPQEYIRDNAPDVLFTVLMRRSMLRIANRVAAKLELQALITGESLAQVASQTMAALACTDAAQDAFGDGIDNGHERGKEREQHAADRRIENGHDRGVFGDRHTADGFAVGGVRRAAEESAHDGADAVAEESLVQTGIGDQIPVHDRGKIFMIGDMLRQFHDTDGNKDKRDIRDRNAVDGIFAARLDRF